MRGLLKSMVFLLGFLVIFLLNLVVPQAELIEPTRNLKGSAEAQSRLTVYSEPPGLAVKLDGAPVGQTPMRIQKVEPGIHRLQVRESVAEIYVEPGKTVHISLFKNEFIHFSVTEKEPLRPPENKTPSQDKSWTPKPSAEEIRTKAENRAAMERWMRFVNGTSRFF